MLPQPIESRVESLENRVTELEQLPARNGGLESQIQQLRTEMHVEFSAVRTELRAEISGQGTSLRAEIAEQGTSLRGEIASLSARIDEQGTHMRVLHEEVISRIALVQEAVSPQPRRPRKKQRP